MTSVLAAVVLAAAAPSIIRVDLQDALRLPSGMETPPADPLVIFIKAPASWVEGGGLSAAGKKAVLARLYGGPGWVNGNSDGSLYVVKSFKSRVLRADEQPAGEKGTFWYVVAADGSLEKSGKDFGAPPELKSPQSFIDHAEKGSIFKQGPKVSDAKAMLDWLGKQKGLVKLPVVLGRGQVGFSSRGAKVGGTTIRVDDTALGISLAERAREACGEAPTCALWLIGRWKGGPPDDLVFAVTRVERPVGPGDRDARLDGYVFFQEG